MSSTTPSALVEPASAAPDALDPRRFRALAVIAVAQLMIVLDATVVTIALPSAQRALHISIANRQWVLTAYALAFGGLLLLGGRIADYLGRKRVFVVSLLGFAASSALGGLAVNQAMLFGARALQGAFAAVMAPAALSIMTVTFTEPTRRACAFGVYGGISGGGAAIGLILGGLLTEYASWRWTLLINAPIAIVTAFAALREVGESRAEGESHYDLRARQQLPVACSPSSMALPVPRPTAGARRSPSVCLLRRPSCSLPSSSSNCAPMRLCCRCG